MSAQANAANDSRFIELVTDYLLGVEHDVAFTDELALAIACNEIQSTAATQMEVARIAYQAQLQKVWKHVQIFKNSNDYQDLLAEHEEALAIAKPEQAIAPATAKKIDAVKAWIATTTDTPEDILQAHKPAKASKSNVVKLDMPAIADLEQLQGMDRKATIDAFKALKSNNPEITLRANAATLELKTQLAGLILNQAYVEPAKASKSRKSKQMQAIALPDGLTWDKVQAMSYRELQGLGKALRSNGHEMPKLNSKGEVLRSAIAKAMNFNVVKVETSTRKPLTDDAFIGKYCKNLAALRNAA